MCKPTILIVEDTVSLARTYMEYLRAEPYDLVHVETGGEAIEAMVKGPPDAVLLDLKLPDMSGFDVLKFLSEKSLPTECVVMTAYGSIDIAVESMRHGAFDFLVKPFSAERLTVTLNNALEHRRLTRIVETYKTNYERDGYCGFDGSSLAMQTVYRIIECAAVSKATVFISGESGTGKEICAEALHTLSERRDGPFIPFNCAAIPRELMESEIFGHVKGAFTGAVSARVGAAKQADGGTLFLDEICEMDPSLQTKLLRFLQTRSFQRVGGDKLEKVDVRFVCATNRDPWEEVLAGRFREDLFYRLNVVPIHMPPLRDREEDVMVIAGKFLADFTAEEGKEFSGFSPRVETIFRTYPWPGNVRQLQNVVHNIVVLNEGGLIDVDMLPSPLGEDAIDAGAGVVPEKHPPQSAGMVRARQVPERTIQSLAETEKAAIERAISLCGGNIPKAAAHLGISASTIYRKRTSWEGGKNAA
jgi:DNA-binding NtrC family response regulator